MSSAPESRRLNSILTVGDGNLSYSLALAKQFITDEAVITATTYDSLPELRTKYGAEKIDATVAELQSLGQRVVHEVDATLLSAKFRGEQFDRIVFMHPLVPGCERKAFMDSERGEKEGGKGEFVTVLTNRRMLIRFLIACVPLLRRSTDGTVQVTIKSLYPYSWWRLDRLAEHVPGLVYLRTEKSQDPPGYESRNVETDRAFPLTAAETFSFGLVRDVQLEEQKTAPAPAPARSFFSFCEICQVKCSGPMDLAGHENAKMHIKRAAVEAAWRKFVAEKGL